MHVEERHGLDELRGLARAQHDARMRIRLQAMVLAKQGRTAVEIAETLGASRRPVQEWVRRYNQSGVEGLQHRPGQGRPEKLTSAERDRFVARLESGPQIGDQVCALRGRDMQRILKDEFGKLYHLNGVYALLHRLGYSCLMPRPQHRKADVQAQETFKKVGAQIESIRQSHPEERVEVWFQDEARFGQQGTLTRVWAQTGSRPRAVRQAQFDYLYVLGAVCPETGQSVGLLAPHLDTPMVNQFLAQFARELAPGVHAVMIWDQAGFHTAKAISVPSTVTLITLPPYLPELNPIENLWHYLRSHFWSNRDYADYDALIDAATHAWRQAALDAPTVKTVCAAPYIQCAAN